MGLLKRLVVIGLYVLASYLFTQYIMTATGDSAAYVVLVSFTLFLFLLSFIEFWVQTKTGVLDNMVEFDSVIFLQLLFLISPFHYISAIVAAIVGVLFLDDKSIGMRSLIEFFVLWQIVSQTSLLASYLLGIDPVIVLPALITASIIYAKQYVSAVTNQKPNPIEKLKKMITAAST